MGIGKGRMFARGATMVKVWASLGAISISLSAATASATRTTKSGQDYITECELAGVPKPPPFNYEDAFHNQNGTQWVNAGILDDPFILSQFVADVFYYAPAGGLCVALPRSTIPGGPGDVPSNINLLGVICQSSTTGKACFWDAEDTSPFETLQATDFDGGQDLAGGDVCTSCHRGENAFLIHPLTALGLGIPNRMPAKWMDPIIVDSKDWPENPGPTTLLDGWPATSCLSCHAAPAGFGGRFPTVSNETSSYCSILNTSFGRTMPHPSPAGAKPEDHPPYQALAAACLAPPAPEQNPAQKMMSFDNAGASDWSSSSSALSFVSTNKTQGTGSLKVSSSGYVRLDSIPFSTWLLPFVGTRLDLDVYVPPGQPNQYWYGTAELFISIPSANIVNAYLGQVALTAGGTGWKKGSFSLPANVKTALSEARSDVRFGIAVNTPSGAPPLLLDNLRFDGTLVPGPLTPAVGPVQLDFERGGSWSEVEGAAIDTSTTSSFAFLGAKSLEVELLGSGSGRFWTVPTVSPAAGATISYRVRLPAGAPISAVQPYIMDNNWAWTDSWNPNLPRDTWVTLTVKVPPNASLPLKQLGLKVYLTQPYAGPINVDAIQW